MPIWRAARWIIWSGFTLSPVLWRKLPGARSAGRVQSVALRLVVEREDEIEAFKAAGILEHRRRCRHRQGRFPGPADPAGRQEAGKTVAGQRGGRQARRRPRSRRRNSPSAASKAKPVKRNPSPPFITSTLQQEAARKLGFNAKRTMQVAQGLYEGVDIGGETVGLITYMRTDGITMVPEAHRRSPRGHRQEIWRPLCAADGRGSMPARPRTPRKRMKRCAPPASRARPRRLRAISMPMRRGFTN